MGVTMNAVVRDKAETYSDFINYKQKIIRQSNTLMRNIPDSDRYTLTSPFMQGFELMGFMSLFVQNIIYAVLILLAILSYFLISSLMIFSVDEKTYEFGMLRALGFKKANIVTLLIIQGSIFSIGGWVVGIISASIFTVLFKYLFFIKFKIQTDFSLETLAIVGSLVFGFAMPLWTNFLSIKKALGNRLRDSLDLYQRGINMWTVVFLKLEKLGISKLQ